MTDILNLFLLSLIGSIIALIGGVIFLFNKRLSSVLEKHSVPFAVGVLITVALVGLIPEAIELIGTNSLVIVLVTFFGAFIFEYLLFDIHHHSDHNHHGKFGSSSILVIIGDTIHNFIDGIAIGASYFVSPGLGLITAISTFLHEVPHEIGDFGILLKSGWKKKDVLIVNVISSSFAILGAFTLMFFSENEILIGSLLSISAGIFLYLGTVDFLPEIVSMKSSKVKAVIPMLIGILVMLFTLNLVPHSHELEEETHTEETTEIHEDI